MRGSHVAALVLSIVSSTALAQTKTPNPGTQTILRSWEPSGSWGVLLTRRPDRSLACGLLSVARNAQYAIGLRQRETGSALVISDPDARTLAGDNLRVFVDDVEIGSYNVTERDPIPGPVHVVAADLADNERTRLTSLFETGASVKFITSTTTFEMPLKGARPALANLNECVLHARKLREK